MNYLHYRLKTICCPTIFIVINEPNYSGLKSNHNYFSKTYHPHLHHQLLLNNGYPLSISISKYSMELTEKEKLNLAPKPKLESS